jgi:hypothetical protein
MSPSAKEIEREVEASRTNVEQTVDALREKMTLGQIVDEAASYFQQTGGSRMFANLGSQVRDNPLPLALVGIGLAWLMSGRGQPGAHSGSDPDFGLQEEYDYQRRIAEGMAEDGHDHEAEHSGAIRRMRDAASSVAGAVSGAAGAVADAAGSVGGTASRAGSGATRFASSAYSAAGSAAHSTRGAATSALYRGAHAYDRAGRLGSAAYRRTSRAGSRAQQSFSNLLETEPLVLGALGIAVGAAVGALLPNSEAENRYMGARRDRLRDDAERFAREKYEQGKAVAEEAFEAVKEEAEAHNLSLSGDGAIVDRVKDVARATAEKVRESSARHGLAGQSDSGERPA